MPFIKTEAVVVSGELPTRDAKGNCELCKSPDMSPYMKLANIIQQDADDRKVLIEWFELCSVCSGKINDTIREISAAYLQDSGTVNSVAGTKEEKDMIYEKLTPVFVCNKCGHAAVMDDINDRRKQAAEEYQKLSGERVKVDPINEKDTLRCPACDGNMSHSENPKYAISDDDDVYELKKELERNFKKSLHETLKKKHPDWTEQELEKECKRFLGAVSFGVPQRILRK